MPLNRKISIIFGISLCGIVGNSAIIPALPKIAHELNVSLLSIGLLITAFTLPGIFLAPVIGVLSDNFGRKQVIIPCLFLFGTAGGLSFFAANFTQLLILRFITGIGGSGLTILAVILIGDFYDGNARVKAMGINTSVINVGMGSFPLVGGALALIGATYPFLLLLLGVVVGFLALFLLENPEGSQASSTFEYFHKSIEYLKKPGSIILFLTAIIAFIVIYGAIHYALTLLFAVKFGLNSFQIGIFSSLLSFTIAATSSQADKIESRLSPRAVLTLAFCFEGISLVMIPIIHRIILMIIPVVIFGFGFGLALPLFLTSATRLGPMELRGVLSSLIYSGIRIGQTTGPILMGLVVLYSSLEIIFLWSAIISFSVSFIGFFAWKIFETGLY
ncbi:MFS transporter [Candidatus Borrarchaeum sp.]|uniref:MFS transporter n=1 Tax=Candidatus Borrarchaeum sp. TaxID=2846742 RepID=UPI0025809C2C|nr:MFS transporter [Candidatus Borrarchaeum sp.]